MARRRYDDDYDEYDRPRRDRPEPVDSGGNTAVKIIAILGAVVLGIALICGGLVYYVVYSVKKGVSTLHEQLSAELEKQKDRMQEELQKQREQTQQELQKRENSNKVKSQKFVALFLQELKAGQAEAAYQMTSAAYQKRLSLEQFRQWLQKNAEVLRRVPILQAGPFDADTATTFRYEATTLGMGGGFVKVAATVLKEGEEWKVDQLAVEPHDPFNKGP
jgi:hypothetical protein